TSQGAAGTKVTTEADTHGPVVVPVAPMSPSAINPKTAATPNAPQTRKYGMTNRTVAVLSAGFVGRPASSRVIPRKARIIGIAEGNIIATIMTTRRAKKRTRSDAKIVDGANRGI